MLKKLVTAIAISLFMAIMEGYPRGRCQPLASS